jgi:hypothetical protein
MPQPPESLKPGATFTGPLKEDDPLLRMSFVVTHPNHPFKTGGKKPGKNTPATSPPEHPPNR